MGDEDEPVLALSLALALGWNPRRPPRLSCQYNCGPRERPCPAYGMQVCSHPTTGLPNAVEPTQHSHCISHKRPEQLSQCSVARVLLEWGAGRPELRGCFSSSDAPDLFAVIDPLLGRGDGDEADS